MKFFTLKSYYYYYYFSFPYPKPQNRNIYIYTIYDMQNSALSVSSSQTRMLRSPHSIAVCFPMLLNGYTSSTVQINVSRLGQLNQLHLKAFTCFGQNSFGASFNSTSLTEASQSYSSLIQVIQLCTEERSSTDVGKIQTRIIKSGFYLNVGQ
jgi:hypothetical protein